MNTNSTSKNLESIALQAVNDGIWDWDVPSGNADFSKAYYAVLGYEDHEFVANYANWIALVHPEDKVRVEKELAESVKSADRFVIDLRMKTKQGGWLWVSTRGKVIENNPDGGAKRMVGTFTDISKQKLLEEQLQAKLREAEMFNELTVGRELKLIELKDRIKELEAKQS